MDSDQGEDHTGVEGSQPTAAKLQAYVARYGGKFTDAAITTELLRAGYAAEDIRAALTEVSGGITARTSRATRTILAAYAVTFALLTIGMLSNSASGGVIVLGVSLGFALLLSLLWARKRRAATATLGALLAIPVVLLIIVAGLCLATGLPVPHSV